jgi:hypothetical protein
MNFDRDAWTFDCEPTLKDSQVLEFCREGYLLLRGVVPDEINQKTCAYLEGRLEAQPCWRPAGWADEEITRVRASHEPSTLFLEDWFIEHVLLNAQLTGVMRSLLGARVGLPVLASHHATECPQGPQGWHHDADHVFGPELEFVEVFYFPQDTPDELGPTEIAPGTHIGHHSHDIDETGVLASGPAGTLGIHHQSILHRRAASTATGMRHMLKYNYWRTTPPVKDWIDEPGLDPATAFYGGHNTARFTAHMFWWLCGKGDDFRIIGGQGWPWRSDQQVGPSYGYGRTRGYLPDWRRNNPDGYSR